MTAPLRERDIVKSNIEMAIYWHQQGLGPEDLPRDMDPEMRRTMEIALTVIREGGEARS